MPAASAAGCTAPLAPPSTASVQALSLPARREVMARRPTAPIEGSASPRKPSVAMCVRSSSGSFEVAWRSTASASSSALIPQPSSLTLMRPRPPSRSVTSMRVAPASMAFSTSSFTAEAGRSTTSPAAMRLTTVGGSTRIGMMQNYTARLRKPAPGAVDLNHRGTEPRGCAEIVKEGDRR